MRFKTIRFKTGWIVFIVHGCEVIEVHSTGRVVNYVDNNAFDKVETTTLNDLCNAAKHNALKSQEPGNCGVIAAN